MINLLAAILFIGALFEHDPLIKAIYSAAGFVILAMSYLKR